MGKRKITIEERAAAKRRGDRLARALEVADISGNDLETAIGAKGGMVSRMINGVNPRSALMWWTKAEAHLGLPAGSLVNDPPGGVECTAGERAEPNDDPRYANRDIFLSHLDKDRIDPLILDGMMRTRLAPEDAGDYPWWRDRYFHLIDERKRTAEMLRDRAKHDAGKPLPAPPPAVVQRHKKGVAG